MRGPLHCGVAVTSPRTSKRNRGAPNLNVVLLIQREAVVDPLWQHDHIPLAAPGWHKGWGCVRAGLSHASARLLLGGHASPEAARQAAGRPRPPAAASPRPRRSLDADPVVVKVAHVKVARAVQDVPGGLGRTRVRAAGWMVGVSRVCVTVWGGDLAMTLADDAWLVGMAHEIHTCVLKGPHRREPGRPGHAAAVKCWTRVGTPGRQPDENLPATCRRGPAPDLLVVVDVLLVEHLYLLIIAGQLVLRDGDDLLRRAGEERRAKSGRRRMRAP